MGFNIPYYPQSAEFTCGPACVLMAFKYFDRRLRLNRTREFEVWRQSNMIGVRGSDPFGLSVPLLDAGYEVRLVTQGRRIIDPALWGRRLRKHRFTPEEARLALFGIGENRKRALARGLSVEYGRITAGRVALFCREGFLPIALVHMGVVHQLDIPHWVVVSDVKDEEVAFNDPYPPKGGKGIRVRTPEFHQMISDVGIRIGLTPSVLFVRKRGPDENPVPLPQADRG